MEIIVFEKDSYWKMQTQLMSMFRETLQQLVKQPDDWISPEEAMTLLGIKRGRLQQLRDRGQITFSQSGRKIRYSKPSILKYLNDNIPSI